MSDSTLPKNDYERGWWDAFDALVTIGMSTDIMYPLDAKKRERLYHAMIRAGEKKGVNVWPLKPNGFH